MLKVTKFDRTLWGQTSFEDIGFDKAKKQFVIFYLDGKKIEFFDVEEQAVLAFIVAQDKDSFIINNLLPYHAYQVKDGKIPRSS
ncbi:hypothetical protein KO561_11625 [Radiobacillus kanasensis]|uniref:hypothetical protein n=1 Tax=Radiobacillus kanasensis TaxID=2844358 RepID=UPI001E5DA7B2|nr:hypothetical protein [Radiobacillus kanasensis]UFT97860.1 hypothetical protein KO561_11625 [Radiobacillus kanasensis]